MTWNSADRLEHWITRTLEYADEVVLLVDESSSDDTYEVARTFGDIVRLVEHPPFIEVFYDLALRQAGGDWILWLDDDEFMGSAFATTRDTLLDDRYLTHYHLPYRWIVRGEDGHDRWIRTFPWHPNPRLRLIRNVGSTYYHRGRLHSPLEIAGEGRIVEPEEAVVYHLDLVWRDRAQREAKVARYRQKTAPSCEEYYLYEDYERTLATEPVLEPLVRAPSPSACREAQARRERQRVDDPHGMPAVVTVEAERERISGFWFNAPLFSAEYLASNTPTVVLANRGCTVEVKVRNTSPVTWFMNGLARGRVVLSYRWVHPEHGVVFRDGDRSLLPHAVKPGEAVTATAGLWTPYEPGNYVLEWDLRCEEGNWFSERGVEPMYVPVEVTGEDRLLDRRRAVAQLPPPPSSNPTSPPKWASSPGAPAVLANLFRAGSRARDAWRARKAPPGGIHGRNVTPLPAVRVLDTRDGTGVPGAVTGPVAAGSTVVLEVAGHTGIPDWAVGVVATLSVPSATYNGYVKISADDRSAAESAIVSGYFSDSNPSAVQVLCPLRDGRLVVWISDNHPGTAQLLLDVVAYLSP
jgi:hypothetical protein